MRILVIDDDRAFTEPLLWRLECEEHDVVYCQYVNEVLDGWHELTAPALNALRHTPGLGSVTAKLQSIVDVREGDAQRFKELVSAQLDSAEAEAHFESIREAARKEALQPPPALVLLDLMMAYKDRYSAEDTDNARATGRALLKDLLTRVPGVPVIVITVRNEPELHNDLRSKFPEIQNVLVKPVTPSVVLRAIGELFCEKP